MKRSPPPHGNYGRYKNHGCRCDACRTAHTAYLRDNKLGPYRLSFCACGAEKDFRAASCRACYVAANVSDHGTESCYGRGCRCEACRKASAAGRSARRHASLDHARAYSRGYKAARRAAGKA